MTFIERYMTAHRNAPAMREIADGCGIPSLSSVDFVLGNLEAAGLLVRARYRNRTFVLVKQRVGMEP